MRMDDLDQVRSQYATETNLLIRRSVWQPTPDGRDPTTEAATAIHAEGPRRILEVGCGTGAFAERVAAQNPDATLVATDQSVRFVALTSERGIEARRADMLELPFADDSFDAVAAMWMLYHVPDVDRGLAEVRRVLRSGGLFVAVTNGDEHLADLRRAAGGLPALTTFSTENGEPALRRHFDDVHREEFTTRARFPDHACANAYLESSQEDVAWDLPPFDGPREYAGHVTLFTCR